MDLDTITDIFRCPITQELFNNPVAADDGYIYEKDAIEDWLKSNHQKLSPMTKQPIQSTVDCSFIRNLIAQLIEKYPSLKEEQHRIDIFRAIDTYNYVDITLYDLTICNMRGETPLMYALNKDKHALIEPLLASAQINLSKESESGETALRLAIQKNKKDLVSKLLVFPSAITDMEKDIRVVPTHDHETIFQIINRADTKDWNFISQMPSSFDKVIDKLLGKENQDNQQELILASFNFCLKHNTKWLLDKVIPCLGTLGKDQFSSQKINEYFMDIISNCNDNTIQTFVKEFSPMVDYQILVRMLESKKRTSCFKLMEDKGYCLDSFFPADYSTETKQERINYIFWLAVTNKYEEVMEIYLNNQIDPNYSNGSSYLLLAVADSGNIPVLDMMLDNSDAKPNLLDTSGTGLIYRMCKIGNSEMALRVIKKCHTEPGYVHPDLKNNQSEDVCLKNKVYSVLEYIWMHKFGLKEGSIDIKKEIELVDSFDTSKEKQMLEQVKKLKFLVWADTNEVSILSRACENKLYDLAMECAKKVRRPELLGTKNKRYSYYGMTPYIKEQYRTPLWHCCKEVCMQEVALVLLDREKELCSHTQMGLDCLFPATENMLLSIVDRLLDRSESDPYKAKDGKTPILNLLNRKASNQDSTFDPEQVLLKIYKNNLIVNKYTDGKDDLFLCCKGKMQDAAIFLIDSGKFDILRQDKDKRCVVDHIFGSRLEKVATHVYQKGILSPDQVFEDGTTLLIRCCQAGFQSLARSVLDTGICKLEVIAKSNLHGSISALAACINSGMEDLAIDIFKTGKSNPNGVSGYNNIPVAACRQKMEKLLDMMLLDGGVDFTPNGSSWNYQSALITATTRGMEDIAIRLLDICDYSAKAASYEIPMGKQSTSRKYTTFELACLNQMTKLKAKLLEKCGGDIRKLTKMSLSQALSLGITEIAEYLMINNPEPINQVNSYGNTPLMLAAKKSDQLDVVKKMLQSGNALLEKKNRSGKTALILACEGKCQDIAMEILKYPTCDMKHKDNKDNDALFYAKKHKLDKVIQELEKLSKDNA